MIRRIIECFRDGPPLTVIVSDDRYDAYGEIPPTSRDAWLYGLLQNQGGINHTVEPGVYHFNAKWRNPLKLELSLNPVP